MYTAISYNFKSQSSNISEIQKNNDQLANEYYIELQKIIDPKYDE